MRFVQWNKHKILIRNFFFLLAGIFLGMFYYLYIHGIYVDQLHKDNSRISLELKDCKNSLESLQKEKKERKQNTSIKSIKFHIEEDIDSFVEAELLSTLMDETHFLVGKNVDDVGKSPEFIYRLLNNKIYKAKEKEFKIKVQIIYVQTTTEIWISIKQQPTTTP